MWPFSHGVACGGPAHPPPPSFGEVGRGPIFDPGCQVTCPPGHGLAGVVWGVNAAVSCGRPLAFAGAFGAPSAVLAL